MAGFYHLIRDVKPADVVQNKRLNFDLLDDVGLTELLADCEHVPDDVIVSGPSTVAKGVSGVVLYPKGPKGADPKAWGFDANHQQWHPVGDGSKRWCGYQKDSPPTPIDLQRKTVLGGVQLIDNCRQPWIVPIARSPHGRSVLPAALIRTTDGVEQVVEAQYRDLWDLSGQVRDWMHDQFDPDNEPVWKYDTAVRILQTNYRVDAHVFNALQHIGRAVLSTHTVDPCLVAFIDWDLPEQLLEATQKKRPPAEAAD